MAIDLDRFNWFEPRLARPFLPGCSRIAPVSLSYVILMLIIPISYLYLCFTDVRGYSVAFALNFVGSGVAVFWKDCFVLTS